MGIALAVLPAAAQTALKIQDLAVGYSGVTLLTVSNTVVTTVFATNQSITLGRVLYRCIQNTGTNAFLYLINPAGSAYPVSNTNYTGVVAAGTAMRDGRGSIVNLSRCPWPISMTCEGTGIATTVAAVELTQ